MKPLKVLKHCTRRWLSLERCLKRLIEQWPALFCYFNKAAESEKDDRARRVAMQLKDPKVKLLSFCCLCSQAFEYFQHCFSNSCQSYRYPTR